MADPHTIIFYDIASGPPVAPYAPNPWKTRYALNFKGVDYKTEWVELPDVTSIRKKLDAAPVRFFGDGEPFHTLPVIEDQSTGRTVGDSFDIAVYLDKTYPNSPSLFAPSTISLHAAFNAHVDRIFTSGYLLFSHGLPFNPKTAVQSKAEFERRAGVFWDELTVRGEERKWELEKYRASLGELARFLRRGEGPFVGGKTASYADLIIGAWLKFMSVTIEEWDEIQWWHDGLWGDLYRLLQEKYGSIR
ncbi:hypothetical protein F4677DRAFT_446980 [Hypoxylon crocopeplum]|nr:hypothetical protein F4677DRAFT_446980 [Hypoxylon crocopeplum]